MILQFERMMEDPLSSFLISFLFYAANVFKPIVNENFK